LGGPASELPTGQPEADFPWLQPSSPSTARRSAADPKTNGKEKSMALEIFWGSGSPYSWRVLLGAEIKG